MKAETDFTSFTNLDIRVGTVLKAEDFPKARNRSYKLWIDFGAELGTLKTSAQITELYTLDELIGRQVVAVMNFGEKQIADFMSQCLVLGTYTQKGVVLLEPSKAVDNGSEIG